MATLTIEYDSHDKAANAIIEFIGKTGLFSFKKESNSSIDNQSHISDREASEIAAICASLRRAETKTRPISQLLEEL